MDSGAGTTKSRAGLANPHTVRRTYQSADAVRAEARRTRRTKSAVVEAFTEETARTRRFAGIAFRGDDARRRAWVIGSGLDVWEIVHMLEDFGSPEALVTDTTVSLTHVRLAVAYRDAYPDEVTEAIADNRRSRDDVGVLFPFITLADAREQRAREDPTAGSWLEERSQAPRPQPAPTRGDHIPVRMRR